MKTAVTHRYGRFVITSKIISRAALVYLLPQPVPVLWWAEW
jgi:hypothetical protein